MKTTYIFIGIISIVILLLAYAWINSASKIGGKIDYTNPFARY